MMLCRRWSKTVCVSWVDDFYFCIYGMLWRKLYSTAEPTDVVIYILISYLIPSLPMCKTSCFYVEREQFYAKLLHYCAFAHLCVCSVRTCHSQSNCYKLVEFKLGFLINLICIYWTKVIRQIHGVTVNLLNSMQERPTSISTISI